MSESVSGFSCFARGSSIPDWDENSIIDVENSPGILKTVAKLIKFRLNPGFESFKAVVDLLLSGDSARLSIFPYHVRHLFPNSWDLHEESQLAMMSELGPDGFAKMLDSQRLGPYYVTSAVRISYNDRKPGLWDRSLYYYPLVCAHDWWSAITGDGFSTLNKTDAMSPDIVVPLVKALLDQPESLRLLHFCWGELVQLSSEDSERLRKAILAYGVRANPIGNTNSRISSFQLRLPDEAALLPILVTALTSAHVWEDSTYSDEAGEASLRWERVRNKVKDWIDESKLERHVLHDIALDINHKTIARAAAFILTLWDSPEELCRDQVQERLVNFYNEEPSIGEWYFRAIALLLAQMGPEHSRYGCARLLVGQLLDTARHDYVARRKLDPLLHLWRETSLAPTQVAGVEQSWMR